MNPGADNRSDAEMAVQFERIIRKVKGSMRYRGSFSTRDILGSLVTRWVNSGEWTRLKELPAEQRRIGESVRRFILDRFEQLRYRGTREDLVEDAVVIPDETALIELIEMAELTAEIIARTVFGNDLGSTAAKEVIEGFSRYQSLIDSFNIGYFLGADEGFPVFRGPRLRKSVRRVHKVIDKVISDHLAGHGDNESMIELLVRRQKRNPDLGLDVSALRNEAATIFMAGHETTAATLTWAWYLLSNAPWVEEQVLAEIERVTGGRMPGVADVPQLEWCRAVIEETLRLYPPVPILARQAREADRIGNVDVDKAALALVVPWTLHRADDLWDRPERFMPERFLGDQRPIPYSYIPFAIGPRICAGMNFGLTESILCLAILIQRYRVRVAEGFKVEPVCRLTLRPRGGMPVTITPRA